MIVVLRLFPAHIPAIRHDLGTLSLPGFIRAVSGWHQLGIAGLSVLLFLLETVPLELQRRIINAVTERGAWQPIVTLAVVYAAVGLTQGLVKLFLNLYRNWVSETAVSWLRLAIFELVGRSEANPPDELAEGVQLAVVVAEAEPIGGFVGDSVSQPLLQIGILSAVTGYLVYLQPVMALIILVVFLPQLGFVQAMQSAINRRVFSKTSVMRAISQGIVEAGNAVDPDGGQHLRIREIFAINMGIYRFKFSMNFLMNAMVLLGNAGILATGAWFVLHGQIEVGTIVAFMSGLAKVNDPWGDLVDWYRTLKVTQVKFELVRSATAAVSTPSEFR